MNNLEYMIDCLFVSIANIHESILIEIVMFQGLQG